MFSPTKMSELKQISKSRWWLTHIMIPLVAGSGIIGLISDKAFNILSYDKTEREIQRSLEEYYEYLNKDERDIDAAYNKLSIAFKSRVPLAVYRRSFEQLRSINKRKENIEVLLNRNRNRATVFVMLDMTTKDDEYERWKGFIEFVEEDGEWVIETMRGLIKTH